MSAFSDEFAAAAIPELLAQFGETVRYYRGEDFVDLAAIPRVVSYEIDSGVGAVIHGQRCDWIVSRADLVFGEGAVDPEAGDRIEFALRTYEVMPVGTESPAEPLDTDCAYWRVHTRLVEVQS